MFIMFLSLLLSVQFLCAADDALPNPLQCIVAKGFYSPPMVRANADGSLVVAATRDTVKVGSIDHLGQDRSLFSQEVKDKQYIIDVAVMSDKQDTFFSSYYDSGDVIKLWDKRDSLCPAQTLKVAAGDGFLSLHALPDDHLLVGRDILWDIRAGKKVEDFDPHPYRFTDHSRMKVGQTGAAHVMISVNGERDDESPPCFPKGFGAVYVHKKTKFPVHLESIANFLALAKCFGLCGGKTKFYDADSSVCITADKSYWPNLGGLHIGCFTRKGLVNRCTIPFYEPLCFIPKKGLVFACAQDDVNIWDVKHSHDKHLESWATSVHDRGNLVAFNINDLMNFMREEYVGLPERTLKGNEENFESFRKKYQDDGIKKEPYENILRIIKDREEHSSND
jgi:hypothetical protein